MQGTLEKLAEYVKEKEQFRDVAELLTHRTSNATTLETRPTSRTRDGHVYLIKWGEHYKIGCSGNVEQRI